MCYTLEKSGFTFMTIFTERVSESHAILFKSAATRDK